MQRAQAALKQLQLLPHDEAVDFLVSQGEGQWLERVSARIHPRQLADLMVGFANAEGGILAIGIHDGAIEGVSRSGKVNDWRQAAIDFTKPPVRHKFELIPCINGTGEADEIAVVELEASERIHTNLKGETYLRIGDENRKLGPLEAQELRYDKGESNYDARLVHGTSIDDFDQSLLAEYRERVRSDSDSARALAARGLVGEEDGTLRATVAGLLVLGNEPQTHLPQAFVRIIRYQGASRETGARANIVDDVRVEGPIVRQIEEARRVIGEWMPQAIRLQEQGRFGRASLIPEFVWLEAVVNAVTHRSYSIGGDHVRIELFEDRVEVESPGRLPGLVRLENIRSSRFARNPRIARALGDFGYGRELGEGVNRMFEEMNRAGLPDPIYAERPSSVQVILLADPLAARILDRLPRGAERFVEFLSRADRVTTTEAVELLGVSRPTALKYLHDLTEQGLVEHVGTSLKDPRGYWRLKRAVGG